MQKIALFLLSFSLIAFSLSAKPPKKKKTNEIPATELGEITIKPQNSITDYKPSKTRYFDLLSTKLDITPVLSNKTVIGKAELLLKPYFYEQNTLTLDAKMMIINSVKLIQK
jgi:aminopeptidase N